MNTFSRMGISDVMLNVQDTMLKKSEYVIVSKNGVSADTWAMAAPFAIHKCHSFYKIKRTVADNLNLLIISGVEFSDSIIYK